MFPTVKHGLYYNCVVVVLLQQKQKQTFCGGESENCSAEFQRKTGFIASGVLNLVIMTQCVTHGVCSS